MSREDIIQKSIITMRGCKVILDSDLAGIYGVPTKALNQAVKRNIEKFPEDFMFKLTRTEYASFLSQIAEDPVNRSQSVTGLQKHRDPRFPPHAFTEHGAIMAATVLNSPRAVQMSIFIVRAFISMRRALMSRIETEKRLDQIEKLLLVHDNSLADLYRKIRPLLLPPAAPSNKKIGFNA